jgi:DNA-binding GntR family transcriptional regulator
MSMISGSVRPGSARAILQVVTPQILAELTASIAMMKDHIGEGDLLAAAQDDFRFRGIIVNLSGNGLFREIHNMYRDLILESQKLPFN